MNVDVKSGKELIEAITPSDSLNYFALNETALETVGWTEAEALQKKISIRHGNQKPGPVRGVIRDFHFQSFHHNIDPLVFEFNPDDFQYLLIKIKPERTTETIQFIADKWKQVAGAIPFEFTFLDQEYAKLYKSEVKTSDLFTVFSFVALFISLLGLFGLSSFAVERRTREIGVRKVFGAGANNIMMLVSGDFMKLLFISFLLSLPIGYYFTQNWLNAFAFKVSGNVPTFILAGIINFVFALVVLSYHVVRISRTRAVDTLKYE
jgi:putative ABC transport system permease protein